MLVATQTPREQSGWALGILSTGALAGMGMALAGLLPSIAKVVRQSVPEQTLGKTLGYLQSSQYAGQVLGPLPGGALGGLAGMRSVFFLTSGLLLAGAGLNCLAKRKAAASRLEEGADAGRATATVIWFLHTSKERK